jgi:hypothetical protein
MNELEVICSANQSLIRESQGLLHDERRILWHGRELPSDENGLLGADYKQRLRNCLRRTRRQQSDQSQPGWEWTLESGVDEDVHDSAASPSSEVHRARSQCEQRVVATSTDIVTRVEVGPALPNNNLARLHLFTTEAFDAEPLRIGVAAISS